MTQIITGKVQSTFDPSAVTSSPYFVAYDWTTAGVWYSSSGTSGTFEPYGGNSVITWTQNQLNTTFNAIFSDVGFYLVGVQCVASVYSVYNGSLIASFTQTAYIGGDQSDIDTSGGSGGHAHKAHAKTAHDGGGGGGILAQAPQSLIYVNDTATNTDDVVESGDTTPCEVVLPSAEPTAVTVALSSVTVPGGGTISITPSTVVVPAGKTMASFTIEGTTGSMSANDVSIHMSGDVAGPDAPVTVFHFDKPTLVINVDGTYQLQGLTYAATPDAVSITAGVTLNPSGTNTSAPQVSSYLLGIVQNGGKRTDKAIFGNPTASWSVMPPGGTLSISVPQEYIVERQIAGGNDALSDTTVPPFYQGGTQIASAGSPTTITKKDNPKFSLIKSEYDVPIVINSTGQQLGDIRYPLTSIGITSVFSDWCSLWNQNKQAMHHFTTSGWSINVSSSSANQTIHPSVGTGGSPVESGPTCNMQLANASNFSINSQGNLMLNYPDTTPH